MLAGVFSHASWMQQSVLKFSNTTQQLQCRSTSQTEPKLQRTIEQKMWPITQIKIPIQNHGS